MDLMVTVLGMDLEAAEMDQEMEGEEMVVDQVKEEEGRVDQVDLGDQEVPQEEWEEWEVWEVWEVWEEWEEWEAVDLTATVPGMVLEAARGITIGRERNLEAEKEKL